MSEELKANNYTKKGNKFGEFEFYNIGKTNLSELKKYKIVPNIDYAAYKNTMPDGLLVDRRNKKALEVITVIEFKNHNKFDTAEKRTEAFEQCNTYCQLVGAKFGIITDTREFYYLNPSGNDTTYIDEKKKERSYSIIQNEDGYDLSVNFPISVDDQIEVDKALKLIQRITNSISDTSSKLKQEQKINPKNLAKSVWQSIWLASGENPDKCLSTFIEIFIFRFLSDLEILQENESGVSVTFETVLKLDKNKTLKYYFNNVRSYVKELFPESDFDKTSIINGFVLDPEIVEHNALFSSILSSFNKFLVDDKGSPIKLNNIEPEFKSKIYEDFLKKSISQKNWGQFFTPRSIVKAIIEMSGIESLSPNSVVGDPACGVGGFLLEPILSKRSSDYTISNGKLNSKLIYLGDDRDPKVIILAKANMLIHLSDLLVNNRTISRNISKKINDTFKSFHSSILGSLTDCANDKFDLILSNPPYVTKGVTNYKEAIKESGELTDYYTINGMGVESFFMEKIVNSLKENGKAFVIIPDGILNRIHENKLRGFIKKYCTINAIISLPIGAFYSTLKKTYILSITKKSTAIIQKDKIFSYLVSDIGESLDVYRSPIENNDLKDMVRQFKYFMADKDTFEPLNIKCKTFDISQFVNESNWCVDKWWSREEKVELGIEDSIDIIDVEEFKDQTAAIAKKLTGFKTKINAINVDLKKEELNILPIKISSLFNLKQGDSFYTQKRIRENSWQGDVPVYSSNTKDNGVLIFIDEKYIKVKDKLYDYCLTWAVDGTSAGHLFVRNKKNKSRKVNKKYLFTFNNHCGVMIPKEKLEFYLNWYRQGIKEDLSLTEIHNYFVRLKEGCPKKSTISIQKVLADIFNNILDLEQDLDEFKLQLSKCDFKDIEITEKIIKNLLPISTKFLVDRIDIDLEYISRNVQPVLFQKTRSYRNHKVGSGQIVDVEINIPINEEGYFDAKKMKAIAAEQIKLENIKIEMLKSLEYLSQLNVVI